MDLNKKLAEWAGIDLTGVPEGCEPHFTKSLDLCFELLVPKLTYISIFYDSKLGYSVSVDDGKAVMAMNENSLALALCKAIEKLIGE